MTTGRIAVIGAGWAGLAAAVTLSAAGRPVHIFEMAARSGGRARRVDVDGQVFDNGQHILIGAYTATLELMRQVGAQSADLLARLPLTLRYPDGRGLQLPPGPALLSFMRGVMTARGWTWRERTLLLRAAASWLARGFRCDASLSVAQLCRRLPASVQFDLIEPLCVAALNTPAAQASATVFLRVLKDALFSGPGAADLLLPRVPLDALLPAPAEQWLEAAGAKFCHSKRVQQLRSAAGGWAVDDEPFASVVLACSATEASRLAAEIAPAWSARAAALRYEPIVTVYLDAPGARLPAPMVALAAGVDAPAQFLFDLGALGGPSGRLACAISGAADWVAQGLPATAEATLRQLTRAFPASTWQQPPVLLRTLAEKRATFRCTPSLDRPPAAVAAGLWAAGDYVDGPYPATLEGAVRSGRAAAREVLS